MGCWHVEILLTIIIHVQILLEPLWAIYSAPLFVSIPISRTYKTGRVQQYENYICPRHQHTLVLLHLNHPHQPV
ncbi:hypothetical protein DFJ58DRAFT_190135 [Suillus subalutaceus]|uniref:uncharacterized protein n=1 Tax=Suillus subalutaceus TaxID=48586 RepID=UPI001B87CDD5|nr:uncharacterized protein DFJ58DRAFT_190135 [Suillus subalutaceus]KAG1836115.1 hypothetical protein DFJ58DRAFT_190135 [Suillus subalutaceus]KAG1884035.1 hypothetical protein F4604DRAFT_234075 [Suillus subluteus]